MILLQNSAYILHKMINANACFAAILTIYCALTIMIVGQVWILAFVL